MARPTKFNPDRGRELIQHIVAGESRREAAEASGVSSRTLATWLARGRAGVPPFAEWVHEFQAAERRAGMGPRGVCRLRERTEPHDSKERWQRFKAQRIAWHLERLGPLEFWRRRLDWLASKGHTRASDRTVAKLRAEGFCIYSTP
jgi:hypothetical protein